MDSTMVDVHCDQKYDKCAVFAIFLQRKVKTDVESFTLTAKLKAASENFNFLR